jgi:MFS family permease
MPQTLAWGSSYCLPAVLADAIAHDTGVSTNWLFGIFSGSLIISALLGPRMGRMSDAGGGNRMLAGSNLLFTVGLVLLAFAHSLPTLVLAWLVLGVGMCGEIHNRESRI